MTLFKRSCSALLAALMLVPLAGCGGESSGTANTTAATTTEDASAENSVTPGIDSLTDEEIAAYAALAAQNADRANVLGSVIEEYYISGRGDNIKFAMYLNTNNLSTSNTASVWHITSALTMMSKLWAIDAGGNGAQYATLHAKTLTAMEYYKGTAYIANYDGNVEQTMYAVNRAGSPGTASLADVAAVYDDQMWIVRELVYCYQLTGVEDYLTQALALTQVCLDAWDVSDDGAGGEVGGIDWGPGYSSKHTCSNAPIIEPLVEIYEILAAEGRENAQYYLDWAIKIYDWTNEHLRLSSGLYGDLVRPQGRELIGSGKNKHWVSTGPLGSLDSTTYSYNTGAMISGAVALYRATGEETYLKEAKTSAQKAYRTFTTTAKINGESYRQYSAYPSQIYRSNTWFNLVLLEGFIDLFPYDTKCASYLAAYQDSLDYAYENYKTEEGLMPRDLYNGWDKAATVSADDSRRPDLDKDIMDQASYAEMYAALSILYSKIAAAQ
ncbi:MAG: hypothetical protein IJX47_00345 [Clostridia bacterium]|nr:hypothetical protein [Clostridia bacterium]